jgi:flagellar secretion chaperone FliS
MTSALLINGPVTNSTLAYRGGLSPAAGLMDGVLERLEAASELDEDGDPAGAGDLLEAAVLLIRELRAGLDLHSGGAIAANVDDLYDYMCRRLGACLRLADATDPMNGLAALHEVSHLLDALRSAWAFMPAEVRAASRKSKAS